MYEHFFNLKETPFSIAPNPHYLYMSRQHHEALAHLIYGVGRDGGFVLLTGEVGTGKTTVCRCFLEQIPGDTDVAFVLNPKLNVEELLATICDELSISYLDDSISIKDYVDCINTFLLHQHAEGRHTVLIIDEAQNLSADVLEQLRLLTNLETHEKKLLQIVLLGQPELQEMFRQPQLRQLSQRVTARFHLNAINAEEIGPYVYHRLAIAGAVDPRSIFPAATTNRLFQISKGIPRVINLICDRAMLGAYSRETRVVDITILNTAANEVLGTGQWALVSRRIPWQTVMILAAALILIGGSATGTWWWIRHATPSTSVTEAVTSEAVQPHLSVSPPPSIAPIPKSLAEVIEPVPVAKAEPIQIEEKHSDALSISTLVDHSQVAEVDAAYVDLYRTWGLEYDPLRDGSPCQFAASASLACLDKLGSLGSIRQLGVPVILKLYAEGGLEKFVVLTKLADESVHVLLNGEEKQVDIKDLDRFWRGNYSLLWKKPASYSGPLQPGTIGPFSKWLSYQLDIWEKKPNPEMGRATYDDTMVERVKAFQRYVGEADDGIVGTITLIQLTRRVDETVPVLFSDRGGS